MENRFQFNHSPLSYGVEPQPFADHHIEIGLGQNQVVANVAVVFLQTGSEFIPKSVLDRWLLAQFKQEEREGCTRCLKAVEIREGHSSAGQIDPMYIQWISESAMNVRSAVEQKTIADDFFFFEFVLKSPMESTPLDFSAFASINEGLHKVPYPEAAILRKVDKMINGRIF